MRVDLFFFSGDNACERKYAELAIEEAYTERIKAHSKYDFEFIIMPWHSSLYLVAESKDDLILTLFKNKKREQIYHFIEPSYGYEINQFFMLNDTEFELTGELEQLTSYSIGTKREFSYGKAFDRQII